MPSADNKKRVLKLQNRLRDRASVKDFELLACNNLPYRLIKSRCLFALK